MSPALSVGTEQPQPKKARIDPERRMTIWSHLRELRKRLIWAVIGIGVGAIVGWFLTPLVTNFIQEPLADLPGGDAQLNFQTLGGAFDLRFRIALWIGTLVTCPWWITQIGLFIWPGLKRSERLHVVGFGVVGVLLFGAGAYSGILFAPHAVQILLSFVPDQAAILLRADSYLNFYLGLVYVFGFSFLIPEFLVALNFAGVLSSRSMVKGWRWATVVAFAFAAFANPIPNPVPMTIQAAVLIALYFLAALVSYLHERHLAKIAQH